jgi:four helix bundle protein
MDADLKNRTRQYALSVIKLFSVLPNSIESQIIGKQLVRSGTSVGAHYREAQFAKSDADFISKIQGSLQELEETIYWLELIEDLQVFPVEKLAPLHREAEELRAILITIAKKVKSRK